MNINLSIIIPLFNEEKNIWPIYKEIKQLDVENFNIEIILVNNGSFDKTKDNINLILNEHNKHINNNIILRTLNLEHNIKYDGGIFKGLEFGKGEYLSWTHGDLQTPIEDVIKIFKYVNGKKNVFGKGYRTNTRGFDGIISRFHEKLASLILGKKMRELNAQPKIFNKEKLKLFKNPPKDFTCLDTYFYYISLLNKFEIIEIDVIFKNRIYGYSKWKGSLKVFLKHLVFNFLYLIKLRIFK